MPAVLAALALGSGLAAAPGGPGPGPGGGKVRVGTPPATLASQAGERLGEEFATAEVRVEVAPAGERALAATSWLREALAPADAPACRPVMEALGLPLESPEPARLAGAWPADRPAAEGSPGGRLLVPESLPPLGPADLELFRTVGLVPFEIAATGEWARCVARERLGPPPRDPLLRAARAARAEGTARLAGIVVTLEGAGLAGDEAGRALPELDRDRAGWPRAAVERLGLDPVRRVLAESFLHDGLRWAAWAYLRGGWRGLAAALERPGTGPAELLVPARRGHTSVAVEGACRLGPRVAGLLLAGDPAGPVADRILDERWEVVAGGRRLRVVVRVEEGADSLLLGALPDGATVVAVRGDEVTVELPVVRPAPVPGTPRNAGSGSSSSSR